MMASYEDNFGYWEIDSPDEAAFFVHVQNQSLSTICQRCKRSVRLMPIKAICAPCAFALEFGAPSSMRQYRQQRRLLRPGAR
jgi:ribosomal protein L37E